MKKTLRAVFLMAVTLVVAQSALAEVVGEKCVQTEAFRQYVDGKKGLSEQESRVDTDLAAMRIKMESHPGGVAERMHDAIETTPVLGSNLSIAKGLLYIFMGLSVFSMIFYISYLIRYNPMKWRLMTSGKTFRLLWRKLKYRNGLAGAAFLAALFLPAYSLAATNVLQDIKMYYAGNEFEKGYVQCKYASGPISLGYSEVNGVAVLSRPDSEFDRDYDVLAHLQGLGKGVSGEDLAALYAQAKTDAHRALVVSLLAATGKDVAGDGAKRIVEALCADRGQDVGRIIERFKALLAAFADTNNRLLANGLVRQFLESSVGRVKTLEGLDGLVDLAAENEAFEIIREATVAAMKPLPNRLPFAESLYAARIYLKIDKDMSRHYFQAIRYEFPEYLKSETVSLKLAALVRELSGVTAFVPLYDTDALYNALRRQPNELRVAVTGFFDAVDPAIAAVAYNSIGMEPGDMVFRNPQTLVLLARLTSVHKKDSPSDFLNALKRAVVEYKVPYSKDMLFEVVEKVRQSPAGFTESVLTQDMNTDCRFDQNNELLLSLIKTLSTEQINAFESYFAKKSSLHEEILEYLFASRKDVFYRLLLTLYKENPASVAHLSFQNDIMDLGAVAPAFSREALAGSSSLPAAYFIAAQALSGPAPDSRLAKRALLPELDALFKVFLSSQEKDLSEKEAITALILLTLAQRQGAAGFTDEAFVLEKMVADYFSQGRQADIAERIEKKKAMLAGMKEEIANRGTGKGMQYAVVGYLVFLVCYIIAATFFSIKFGCNMLVPGKNYSLLSYCIYAMEAGGAFTMSTIILLPFGLVSVLAAQLARGFLYSDRVTLDMREGLAALRGEYASPPPGADGNVGRERG